MSGTQTHKETSSYQLSPTSGNIRKQKYFTSCGPEIPIYKEMSVNTGKTKPLHLKN